MGGLDKKHMVARLEERVTAESQEPNAGDRCGRYEILGIGGERDACAPLPLDVDQLFGDRAEGGPSVTDTHGRPLCKLLRLGRAERTEEAASQFPPSFLLVNHRRTARQQACCASVPTDLHPGQSEHESLGRSMPEMSDYRRSNRSQCGLLLLDAGSFDCPQCRCLEMLKVSTNLGVSRGDPKRKDSEVSPGNDEHCPPR
jgi:hypothetical protein